MAEILRLPQRRRRQTTASAPMEPVEGKVLFFTGVRYQRAETPAPTPDKHGGNSGKRGSSRSRPRARRA